MNLLVRVDRNIDELSIQNIESGEKNEFCHV